MRSLFKQTQSASKYLAFKPMNCFAYGKIQKDLQATLKKLSTEGLYKKERVIVTPQGSLIAVSTG